ncbi:MAG TPA: translation initiation factor IF-2 N-terminal domain-containing protein, partial [Candidatus Avimonas sp.]|nr:translation initiation factor IF-2 N-terminal domain-containing protein [Candidatus Avimonas sp.]
MLIKYRVNEVAKDFGKTSKDVLNILSQHLGVTKKSMSTLEEGELNFLFDFFTQESQVENFDEYFATAAAEDEGKKDEEKAPEAAQPAAQKADSGKKQKAEKPADKGAASKADKKPAAPAAEQKPQKAQNTQNVQEKPKAEQQRPTVERRMIDTRTPQNILINKYDEKFDDLAQTSNRIKDDVGGRKQKIVQRSQQLKKGKGRRETEAERLKRIEMERKSKPITIPVGDTVTVGELASRLKVTA